MPTVLTNLHVINCAHGFPVTKTTASKLVVQGQPALTNLGPANCTLAPPPMSNIACTAVTITAGKATKLNVGGTPVLLSNLAAKALPPANPGGSLVFLPSPATPTKMSAV